MGSIKSYAILLVVISVVNVFAIQQPPVQAVTSAGSYSLAIESKPGDEEDFALALLASKSEFACERTNKITEPCSDDPSRKVPAGYVSRSSRNRSAGSR